MSTMSRRIYTMETKLSTLLSMFCGSWIKLLFLKTQNLNYVSVDSIPCSYRKVVKKTITIFEKMTHSKKKDSPVRIFWNAASTLVESSAEVSIKLNPFRSAKDLASSVGTDRRCLKSDLLPTNIITIFWSAWSRNSLSHLSTFS